MPISPVGFMLKTTYNYGEVLTHRHAQSHLEHSITTAERTPVWNFCNQGYTSDPPNPKLHVEYRSECPHLHICPYWGPQQRIQSCYVCALATE